MDYKQQRPFQELVAKDLHRIEWKLWHIYRGQPQRYLFATLYSMSSDEWENSDHLVALCPSCMERRREKRKVE
ncbi:auxin response factor 4-like, partial [Olea europaea subsp. europaea]